MFRMKGQMSTNLVLERTDKYGKSVVAKMESLPDGVYFIKKSKERFGVCSAVVLAEPNAVVEEPKVKVPEKKEVKPNKATSVTKKTFKLKTGKKK